MSWSEALKELANVDPRDNLSTDANVDRSTSSTTWDPHEVWLTRVKRPREQAASRAPSDAESRVRSLPD